jgi:hypothetical protein
LFLNKLQHAAFLSVSILIMKIYRIALYCLLLIGTLVQPVLASPIPQKWDQGQIFLNGEVLTGDVSFHPQHDVVFYKSDGQIKTFSPHTAASFSFYDEAAGLTRTFSALSPGTDGSQRQKAFYEITVEGDLTLARKGKFAKRKNARGNAHPLACFVMLPPQTEQDLVYDYYLVSAEGLTKIRHFRKQVLPLMADREEEMAQFINSFSFNLSNPLSYILVINYYNQINRGVLTQRN